MSSDAEMGLVVQFPEIRSGRERLVLVKTSYAKFGNGADPALAEMAAAHRMARDGGGMMIGSGDYENYYYGLPPDAEAFEAAVVAAGYEIIRLPPA
jgi:poly-gamma-glutamate capsule biosynthesis protein CapA/YwtB (metallophosphatase superfamily)